MGKVKLYIFAVTRSIRCTIYPRIVRLICTAFGVSEAWLKDGEGPMFYNTQTRLVGEAADIFKKINPFFQSYFPDQLQKIYEYQKENRGKTDYHPEVL